MILLSLSTRVYSERKEFAPEELQFRVDPFPVEALCTGKQVLKIVSLERMAEYLPCIHSPKLNNDIVKQIAYPLDEGDNYLTV